MKEDLSDTSHPSVTTTTLSIVPPSAVSDPAETRRIRVRTFLLNLFYIFFPSLQFMSETAFRFHPLRNSMDGYSPSPFYDWPSTPDILKLPSDLPSEDVLVCVCLYCSSLAATLLPVVFAKKCTVIDSSLSLFGNVCSNFVRSPFKKTLSYIDSALMSIKKTGRRKMQKWEKRWMSDWFFVNLFISVILAFIVNFGLIEFSL